MRRYYKTTHGNFLNTVLEPMIMSKLSIAEREHLEQYKLQVAENNLLYQVNYSPLVWAIVGDDLPCIRLMLEDGVDVNEPCANGYRPLMWSALHQRTTITQLLLHYNADPSLTSSNGDTATKYAMQHGTFSDIKILLDLDIREDGDSLLMRAITYEVPRGISVMLENGGIDLEETDSKGRTALHHAIAFGNEAIVDILIDAGANIEARDYNGRTPLIKATAHGFPNLVQKLLDNDVAIDTRDNEGETAIMWAEALGRGKIFTMLNKYYQVVPVISSPDNDIRRIYGFHTAILADQERQADYNISSWFADDAPSTINLHTKRVVAERTTGGQQVGI
jgi:ankyrin repeat protein